MKISELNNAPQWLINADTNDGDVDIIDGVVVWHGGIWRGGEWHDGVWYGGTWCGGVWRGGVWRGGEWRGGALYKHSPYYTCAIGDIVKIGCQEKTRAEWDKIFSNAHEIDNIERGTELARTVYAEYKAMCAYKDAWDSDIWK